MKKYVEKYCDKWWILSAKYYLTNPESIIECYDISLNQMKKAEIIEWARKTAAQIKEKIPTDGTQIEFHAGLKYKNELEKMLRNMGYNIATDLRSGMQIGKRLSWYNKNI